MAMASTSGYLDVMGIGDGRLDIFILLIKHLRGIASGLCCNSRESAVAAGATGFPTCNVIPQRTAGILK